MPENVEGTTLALARFAVELEWDRIPAEVVREGKRALLDFHGVALAGSREPVVAKVMSVYGPRAGAPEAALIGGGRRVDVLSATLVNAVAGHALDFDDTHGDFFYHGSVPVAPVVWALGESLDASGRDVLLAFITGWEVGARIARAVYPALYRKGWQGTATVGTFAAAVAAGKLLGLDVEGMRNAIGLAAAQAGGTRQMLGTMAKPFQCGKTAMNGLLAGLLTRAGLTSSLIALEAPLGFAALTAPQFDLHKAVRDLGAAFELPRNTYKPYCCCLKHHPIVDAFLALRRDCSVHGERLRSAVCAVHPAVLDSANVDAPRTSAEGKFSVQHSAGVALVDGKATIPQYTDERVQDPALGALRSRLRFVADPGLGPEQCALTAILTDGSERAVRIEHALGSLGQPLSDADLETKFRDLAGAIIGEPGQTRLLASIRNLDAVKSVREVVGDW